MVSESLSELSGRPELLEEGAHAFQSQCWLWELRVSWCSAAYRKRSQPFTHVQKSDARTGKVLSGHPAQSKPSSTLGLGLCANPTQFQPVGGLLIWRLSSQWTVLHGDSWSLLFRDGYLLPPLALPWASTPVSSISIKAKSALA